MRSHDVAPRRVRDVVAVVLAGGRGARLDPLIHRRRASPHPLDPAPQRRPLPRSAQARQLVQFSDMTITAVALAVGYSGPAPMVRHYRDEFGLSPQEDRAARNHFRQKGTAPRFAAQG